MAKFPEAMARLFQNVFVCRKCKTKIRSQQIKILQKKVKCRSCGGKSFKPLRKK